MEGDEQKFFHLKWFREISFDYFVDFGYNSGADIRLKTLTFKLKFIVLTIFEESYLELRRFYGYNNLSCAKKFKFFLF